MKRNFVCIGRINSACRVSNLLWASVYSSRRVSPIPDRAACVITVITVTWTEGDIVSLSLEP